MTSIKESVALISPDNVGNQDGASMEFLSHPADHCLVTIEEHDVHGSRTSIGKSKTNSDLELASKVPSLPFGKDKHLFVSHSSENFEEVMEIVNQLEQRFNVSCIISERDFQSGKEIIANIKDSMRRSMKNVLMLTPEFVQSGFCKYEQSMAFMTSVQSGISTVIPVLLHECNIPTSLETVTYIDGTLPGVDIPAKIIQDLIQSELTHGTLMMDDHAITRRYENAFCVEIQSQRENVCGWCKPTEYTFSVTEEDLESLRHAKIKLPVQILTDAFSLLNHRGKVRLHFYIRNRFDMFALSLLTLPLWLCMLYMVLILIINTRRMAPVHLFADPETILVVFFLGFVSFVGLVSYVVPRICNTREQEVDLQMAVWEQIGQRCIQNNTIVLVERKRNKVPTEYLAAMIRSRERGEQSVVDIDPEIRADEMIDRAITRLLRYLSPGLEELPDAPYNRHNVRKSKMCLCQMVEAGSPLVN